MIISATLINSQGCEFDSLTFCQSWGIKNPDAASLAKAKRWARQRGGKYALNVVKSGKHDAWWQTLGEFAYSGKCRRAVAL
jgi:hypothetical protein